MDWDVLYESQNELDAIIMKDVSRSKEEIRESKFLAVSVELGELANELRFFKYWSKKPRSSRGICLEEYIDILHFLLSIGNDYGFRYEGSYVVDVTDEEEADINAVCNDFLLAIGVFRKYPYESNYTYMFRVFLVIGNLLGFYPTEIIRAYYQKNDKNVDRQENGY